MASSQVQKSEMCLLVLGFLKDFKFKASHEAFQKECEPIVRSLKRISVHKYPFKYLFIMCVLVMLTNTSGKTS